MTPITRAVEAVGGQQSELAKRISVSPQVVNQWVNGTRPVPAHHCIAIEEATAGQVTRYDLRPDVFGEPPEGDTPARRSPAAKEGGAAETDAPSAAVTDKAA